MAICFIFRVHANSLLWRVVGGRPNQGSAVKLNYSDKRDGAQHRHPSTHPNGQIVTDLKNSR